MKTELSELFCDDTLCKMLGMHFKVKTVTINSSEVLTTDDDN